MCPACISSRQVAPGDQCEAVSGASLAAPSRWVGEGTWAPAPASRAAFTSGGSPDLSQLVASVSVVPFSRLYANGAENFLQKVPPHPSRVPFTVPHLPCSSILPLELTSQFCRPLPDPVPAWLGISCSGCSLGGLPS